MKFSVIYFALLFVSSLTYTMDENSQRDLWAPRVEQAIQDRVKFDIFYLQNSLQYKADQELLKKIDRTEKYIFKKMQYLNKVIPGDFAEIITSIVDSKMNSPLNLNDIGSAQSAEERLLKIRAISFKEDAICLLKHVESVRRRVETSAFVKPSKK